MSGHPPMGGSQAGRPQVGPRGGPGAGFTRGVEKAKNPTATLVRLIRYLLMFKFQLVLVGVCVVLGSVLSLLGPYYIGVAIDKYIRTGDISGLYGLVILLLGIYFTNYAAQALQASLMARISQRALRQLRKELFEHLQTLSLSFFDRRTQAS